MLDSSSRRMDECLLYTEPELYDLLFPAAAAAESAAERFYVEEARGGGGRVLELGCGSGRLTLPIAQAGIEIMGADVSKSMLATARAKARTARVPVQFVEADMRSFDLPGPFSAILIPGNTLLHLLTIEELKQCLASVRRHLPKRGRLVFDISKWDLRRLARDPAQRYPIPGVNHLAVEETSDYDAAAQVRHVKLHLPDSRVIEYHLRVIFPQELRLLLESCGFRLDARYGEFPRQPFDSSSPRQVCICSPA